MYRFQDTHECEDCGQEFEYSDSDVREWWEEDCEGKVIHFQQIHCPHCGEQYTM